jgi:hypothetical protein
MANDATKPLLPRDLSSPDSPLPIRRNRTFNITADPVAIVKPSKPGPRPRSRRTAAQTTPNTEAQDTLPSPFSFKLTERRQRRGRSPEAQPTAGDEDRVLGQIVLSLSRLTVCSLEPKGPLPNQTVAQLYRGVRGEICAKCLQELNGKDSKEILQCCNEGKEKCCRVYHLGTNNAANGICIICSFPCARRVCERARPPQHRKSSALLALSCMRRLCRVRSQVEGEKRESKLLRVR